MASAAGSVILAASLLAGCSSSGDEASKPTATGVKVAHPVSGFSPLAKWKVNASTLEDGSVSTQAGPVVLVRGSDGMYTLRGLSVKDGHVTWESRPFPSEGKAPLVRVTTQLGRPYVLVVTGKSAEQQLAVYDAYSTQRDSAPISRLKMTAESGDGVNVVASSSGVLFTGAKKPAAAFTVDLPTGSSSAYGKSPSFEGSTDGKPKSVMNGAFLISYPKGYVTASGYTTGSWTSKTTPKGMKAGTGRLLSSGDSLVVSRWERSGGGGAVIAQSALNGQVLAVADEAKGEAASEDTSAVVRLAYDGNWAAWKGYSFDLRSHKGSFVESAAEVRPVMIVRGSLYGMDGDKPVVVKLKDGANAKVSALSMKPVGMTASGLGVFSDNNDVFAIPLK